MRYATPVLLLTLATVPLAACGDGGDAPEPDDPGQQEAPAAEAPAEEEPAGSFQITLTGAVETELSGTDVSTRRAISMPDRPEELRIDLDAERADETCRISLRVPVGEAPVGEEEGTYELLPREERPENDPTQAMIQCNFTLVDGGTTRNVTETRGTIEIIRATEEILEGRVDLTGEVLDSDSPDMREVRVTGTFTVPR